MEPQATPPDSAQPTGQTHRRVTAPQEAVRPRTMPAPTVSDASGVKQHTMPAPVVADPTAWRTHLARLWAYASDPFPPPPRSDAFGRFAYGLAQPMFGIRLMLRDRGLLGSALAPVLAVAFVCGVFATQKIDDGIWTTIITFFAAFGALIPVPPVLFARFYARIAARARNELGLGPCIPYLKPISQSFGESIAQVVVIAIGVAPLTVMAGLMPLTGAIVAAVVQALWTMHWVVVEGLDNARTLDPSETVESVQQAEARDRHTPWFVRILAQPMPGALKLLLLPLKITTEIVMGLSRGWSPELRIIERDRWLAAGFGLGTMVLLAIPGVNLFFRPALSIAGAHLRGRLEREPADA